MGSKTSSKTGKGSKQNGSKANGGKLQSQETQIEKESNGDSHTDFSMLRKPIDVSVSGVGQVVKVYQTGTAEVRELLAYECDLVYECKVCRNLFRSLANFLSHKRVYCREQHSDTKHVLPANCLVEDRTTIVQPESVPPGPCTETWVTNDATPDPTVPAGSGDDSEGPSSPRIETSIPRIAPFSNPKKDLSQIVERLSQQKGITSVTETVGHISASKFYETVSEQVTAQRDARKEHVIRLEAIENTKFGVFQTVLQSSSTVQMENTDLMKTQVVELHNMMTCNEATLGPDGQIAMMTGEGTTLLAVTANSNENGVVPVRKQDSAQNNKTGSSKENHVCTICNTRFSTRKTLNHHMKSLHVTFRMCYPCPCCKNTFCNTWSVYRHLYKVHRKTTIQVRKLRSQIVNKAFRKEVSDYESQNAKSSGAAIQTEADKARKEQQRLRQENQAWMNNFEEDLELQMCGGCGRRFERRAALNSHSQICQKRIAIKNNIKARRLSPSISTTTTTTTSTTSNRTTSTKVLPTSTDRQHPPRTENTKNDITCVESNASRLTPLSVLSESMQSTASGVKCTLTPSPSPVPLEISNQLLASSPTGSYHRSRHCSGSRTDTIKKDIPEKRIEIQIRRDYCKTGAGAGTVSSIVGVGGPSSQQDSNSEINENPLSYGDTGEGSNHDELSDEDSEGHSSLYQSRESASCFSKTDPHLSCDKLDGNIGMNEYSCTETIEKETIMREEQNSNAQYIHPVQAVRNLNDDETSIQSGKDIGFNSNGNQSDESSDVSGKKKTDASTRHFIRFSEKQTPIGNKESDRRTSRDSASSAALSESSEFQDEVRTAVNEQVNDSPPSANTKKEEQFSPVMENRMQSMINIRRLQCLPCQKKFNKLTNLRRHVAVHIGWNRYRCIECTFKCFSKYDCVRHINKMHLGKGEHDKAQAMVKYIETQISDVENDSNKIEPTEENQKSQSNGNGKNFTHIPNTDFGNRYDGKSEDIDIPVNDTPCNNVSDWSLQECDESKTINSDYNISNDIQNSALKVEEAEGDYVYASTVEEQQAKDAISNKQNPVVITGDNTTTTIKMKSGKGNETVVRDTSAILQGEEESKHNVHTSSLRLRPKKRSASTESMGHEKPEAIPSKKLLTTSEYQQNIRNVAVLDVEESDAHKPKTIDVDSETNMHNDPIPTSTEGTSQVQEQSALRKMVLEVIFGSGSVNQDSEATQNMFTVEMNGEHGQSGESISSPEPYDVETVSCDSTSPLTTNSSAASPVLTSDDAASIVTEHTSSVKDEGKSGRQNRLGNSNSPINEAERRQRPVRNRIKVEREDFIYDLSDRCLDPRRDGDDRSSHSSKVTKRKQEDRMRDSVKMVFEKGNCSGESSSTKHLPKLMLVRTNMGEYSGVKVVKSGSSSNATQVLDNNSAKNDSSSTVGYNISTRKSQRTYDISPHKVPTVNKERSE